MKTPLILSVISAIFINILNIPVPLQSENPKHFNQPLRFSTYDTLPVDDFVEDQGTASTCWAISANTLFELYIRKHYGESLDLSTDHLIRNVPVQSTYLSGGNFEIALAYYLNRSGPVDEDHKSPYWLKSYSRHTNDFYAAKHLIRKNGAVITSIFYDANRPGFYNETTNAYYNPSTTNPITHNVILVGWDDTYSRNNFRNKPEKDGAFIAQNSFGSDWGDRGLFYISYEDVHVLTEFYSIEEIEPSQNASHMYYYNETGITHFDGFPLVEKIYAVNIFQNSSTYFEKIESIGFYSNEKNTSVRFSVGLGDFDPLSFVFPEDSMMHRLFTPGYHQLDYLDDLIVPPGESFYVVAQITGPSPFVVPLEAPYPNMDYTVESLPFEGYLGSGSEWIPNHLFRENSSIGIRIYTHSLND